jgi:integrase
LPYLPKVDYVLVPYGNTKTARRRVPLSRKPADVLTSRLINTGGEYLFPGMKTVKNANSHIIKLKNADRGAMNRCGLEPFRLYDLRHRFATRAAGAGVDLFTLASLLRHSRIQMVIRYAHPTEEHQINAIRKIEAN